MPIIAKGISRRNGIAFYSHTGIAGGLLKSTIMQEMIVPGNAVTRKIVTAERMPVRSKTVAAK